MFYQKNYHKIDTEEAASDNDDVLYTDSLLNNK